MDAARSPSPSGVGSDFAFQSVVGSDGPTGANFARFTNPPSVTSRTPNSRSRNWNPTICHRSDADLRWPSSNVND